jgi:calcineurin-like phosphoesterase family protein
VLRGVQLRHVLIVASLVTIACMNGDTAGPGSIKRLTISPHVTTIPAGDSTRFQAAGSTASGAVETVPVHWSATGGTISAAGLYTAGLDSGSFFVVATEQTGTLADTATVVITPSLAHIVQVPDSATLDVGGVVQFAAYGRMTDGDSVAVSVTYSATGGSITAAGLYTAGQIAGTFQVIATQQGGTLADTSIVTITPALQHVVLVPAAATLQFGGTQQFTAFGRMSTGDSVPVSVDYAASGGTLSPAGLYTAGRAAGTFQVIATQQGATLADTSTVTIIAPTLTNVALEPATAALVVGATQQFTAYGRMSNGDSSAVGVTYAATGGTITAAGLYTAGQTAGTFAVIATVQGGTLADTSSVTITPTLQQVVLVPAAATVAVGATQQFAVYGRISNGDSVPVSVAYIATGGTITPSGFYTAGQTAGTFPVIATQQGGFLADTSFVTIAPTLRHVVLLPASVTLDVGTTQQFTAYGTMSNGDSVAVSVTYAATGGTITSSGLYTAGTTAGTFGVIATAAGGTLADTSQVTISAPTLSRIVIQPKTVALNEGAPQQFGAYGLMSNGDSVSVSLTYSATGGTITSAGLYTAGQSPGTFRVIAAGPGGALADTASVIINAPPALAQVVVVPPSVTLVEATTQQFFAYGRNTAGDSVGVTVTYSAKGGTITTSGLYTAGRSTGTFRVIAKQSGGALADTAMVKIVAPTLVQVVLVPASTSLFEGAAQQFAAYGRMNNGDSVAVSATYSATGGTITSSGLYAAGQTDGTFRVIAAAQGLADTATITIAPPPPPAQLILLPSTASVPTGATQQFVVYGRTSAGDSVPVAVTWSAQGGTITSTGLYSAGQTTGTFKVIAKQTSGALADTAKVTITAPPIVQLVLVPSSVTLQVGATQQFGAYGRTSAGDSVAMTVTWSATGGTISSSGKYTAGKTTGTFRVIAKQSGGSLADTSSVTITTSGGGGSVVLVGAGDIASCSSTDDEATASLLDNISGTVFTAGDNAYPDGSAADYACYDASWGRHKSRTSPSPGNHEYNTPGAAGYFGYFGSAAGPSGRGYYSYDLGSWHIISLDSEIPMSAGSAQETWLRADLAASTKQCTLAYWHRPRFSSGTDHGSAADVQPLWQALYDYGAEIVVSGHEHNYERFAPQTPSGAADPAKGIREFVSGTGGESHYNDEGTPLANSQVFNGTTFGVLKLTLGSGTYSWQFIPVSGGSFTDSGSGSCH